MLVSAVSQVYLLAEASFGTRMCDGGGEVSLSLGRAAEAMKILYCMLGGAGLRTT